MGEESPDQVLVGEDFYLAPGCRQKSLVRSSGLGVGVKIGSSGQGTNNSIEMLASGLAEITGLVAPEDPHVWCDHASRQNCEGGTLQGLDRSC